jgi:hypothetical protein
MWKVKYWDGSYEEETFSNQNEAVKAARKGLQDWMNDGDFVCQEMTDDKLNFTLWVRDTDASVDIFKI